MVEIVDFILANVENIVSYRLVGYFMDATVVEFTMANGEKIEKNFLKSLTKIQKCDIINT